MLSLFPRGVLDEILNLMESVSEGFPSYFYRYLKKNTQESQYTSALSVLKWFGVSKSICSTIVYSKFLFSSYNLHYSEIFVLFDNKFIFICKHICLIADCSIIQDNKPLEYE